jgi:hypothetical protein
LFLDLYYIHLQWRPLNVITDNIIIWLMLSVLQSPLPNWQKRKPVKKNYPSVNVIIQLLLSFFVWPKVITLSGAYCIWKEVWYFKGFSLSSKGYFETKQKKIKITQLSNPKVQLFWIYWKKTKRYMNNWINIILIKMYFFSSRFGVISLGD